MSDYPWFKSYPSEVPQTIELNRYNNLVEIFDQSVQKFGNKTAYKNMDVEISSTTYLHMLMPLFGTFKTKQNLKKETELRSKCPIYFNSQLLFSPV